MRISKGVILAGVVLTLAFTSAAAIPMLASAPAQSKTIEAERLVIRDSKGRVRIELAVVDNEPVIRMLNEFGQPFFDVLAADSYEGFRIRTYSGGSMGNWDPINVLTTDDPILDRLQLAALEMTAHLNTDAYGLTDRLVKKSLRAQAVLLPPEYERYGIQAIVDTETQPTWDYYRTYLGSGYFSVAESAVREAYEEAAEWLYSEMCSWDGVWADDDIQIVFQVCGQYVGTWRNGVIELADGLSLLGE